MKYEKVIPVVFCWVYLLILMPKRRIQTVAIKASVTGATCNIVPTPTEINFNTLTAGDIGNNRIAAKEVSLALTVTGLLKM